MKYDHHIESMTEKMACLSRIITGYPSIMIAFSGGKDSFFLSRFAQDVLAPGCVDLVTVQTSFNSRNDDRRVAYLSGRLNTPPRILKLDLTPVKYLWTNPRDRCYVCKKEIFSLLGAEAETKNIPVIFDGSTVSDRSEFRPGMKALEELGVRSPLMECGITSAEVAAYLKDQDIEDYYLTSSTCMATRFPYDHILSGEDLRSFDHIEAFLVDQGVYPVRVRWIPDGIRVETDPDNFEFLIDKRAALREICRGYGMKFVTLDLEGLRTGVWD